MSLANSCHVNTVLLILSSVPQKLPVSSCWLWVLPFSNAFTVLSQHRMSNVFPELLSINVSVYLLMYTVKLCLKNLTVLPQAKKVALQYFKLLSVQMDPLKARPLQTLNVWPTDKKQLNNEGLPSQRSPSNLLR